MDTDCSLPPAVRRYSVRKREPDPSALALLVIDMQEYFRGVGSVILEPLKRTIAACRKAGVPVIFTQDGHKNPHDEKAGKNLLEWWGGLIMEGTSDANLIPEVECQPTDHIVRKSGYDAFKNTELESVLQKLQRSQLLVTGVMSNLCCETTARAAFCNGYQVFFSTDATSTANDELHYATLKNLSYGFAYLVDSGNLERTLLPEE